MENVSNKHYYWLDLLRWIAAMLVVIAHARANFFQIFANLHVESQTIFTKFFYFITSFSDDAVLLFFLLSGFLVGGKTVEKIIHKEEVNHKQFIATRMARVMLPLIAALVIIWTIEFLCNGKCDIVLFVGHVFSLQGVFVPNSVGALWTMPMIVWYYVFIYSLILLFKKKNTYKLCGLIIMIMSLSVFTLLNKNVGTYYFFIMSFGVLAYFLSKMKLPWHLLIICIIVMLITAVCTKFAKPSISREHSFLSDMNVPLLNLIESISMAIILSQIVRNTPSHKFSIMINKYGTKLSASSYSLYLIHPAVITLMLYFGFPKVYDVNMTNILLLIAEVLICMVGGYILYLLVEKPTDKLKKYFYKRLE